MDLRQLRYFVAIAETGSFSAAAASLRIAQSALSRQVQALEVSCRGALFERGARGVVMTEAGALLLTRARFLLAEAASTMTEVAELNNEPSGLVRLAAPPSFGDILNPLLAVGVLRRFPRVQLELHDALNDAALADLRQGGLDLAVVSAPGPEQHIDFFPLCAEPMILTGLPNDPLLRVAAFPLEDLLTLPLIMPVGSGWLSIVRKRLGPKANAAQANARVRTQSPGPMKAMIRARRADSGNVVRHAGRGFQFAASIGGTPGSAGGAGGDGSGRRHPNRDGRDRGGWGVWVARCLTHGLDQ